MEDSPLLELTAVRAAAQRCLLRGGRGRHCAGCGSATELSAGPDAGSILLPVCSNK
jgi:hypothetical protein